MDVVVVLGLICVMFENVWYDDGFVWCWINGLFFVWDDID